jgi:hypothetical protein
LAACSAAAGGSVTISASSGGRDGSGMAGTGYLFLPTVNGNSTVVPDRYQAGCRRDIAARSLRPSTAESADQRSGAACIPAPCHRSLAAHVASSQPEGSDDVGTDDAASDRLASETGYPPSLAQRSLRRHTPVEIEFASGARMRVTGAVDPATLTAAVSALADGRRR